MFSEVDSDDDTGFPMVGEGDDVSHFLSDGVLADFEAELAADEEWSMAVAFAGDSYDDRDGSDQSLFLPFDEPIAGVSSNSVAAPPSPGTSTTTSSSTIDVTPVSKSTTRRRISNKRGCWAPTPSQKKCKPPNPLVFLSNPCLYNNLPLRSMGRVKLRIAQKKCRYVRSMKMGVDVTLRGNTYSWPQDPALIPAFMSEFVASMLHEIVACPLGEPRTVVMPWNVL